MKKLIITILTVLTLAGCVAPKSPDPADAATRATVTVPVIPGPQEMPEKPPENTLPPGENNIPKETFTH